MTVAVYLSDPSRGTVTPSQLHFDGSNWEALQQVTLDFVAAAQTTADSSIFNVEFLLDSPLLAFHGQQPRAWVIRPAIL